MKNYNLYLRQNFYFLILLSILFSSTIFPQQFKTKYDTVDCSKFSCEQWGMKNASCTDMDLEQWPAHCASCGQLSLFLEEKFDELDYNIYNSVLFCTLEEIRCKIAKDIGWLPSIGTEKIYNNNSFKTENRTVIEQGFTYSYSSNWQGNRWVSSKTTVEVPEGYPNTIGWGRCGIKQKITFVNNGKDDSVPGISVGIYAYETPIALGNRIIDEFYASLETNYNIAKAHIYNQLNSATDNWTEDEKEGAIHSIKWSYSDSRMSATACEEKYFGTDIELEAEEIIEEEPEQDWSIDIDDNTIVEPPNLNPYDEEKFESGNYEINNSNEEETLKQIVCATAKPSFTEGSKFKRAKFTIGGTEPQRIKITSSSADNFSIKKEYGGLVYQVIKGTSWGSLTLEPGSYILSCNGGGALGLMSASVCIENPKAGQSPPLNLPPVNPRPERDDDTGLEDSKPVLPEGPYDKIVVCSNDPYDCKGDLTMQVGDNKVLSVWGENAWGKQGIITIDEWKVQGKKNVVSIDKDGLLKAEAEGKVSIRATGKNKEGNDIYGVISITVTVDPPIIFVGKVEVYDVNGKLINPGGCEVKLTAASYKNQVDWKNYDKVDYFEYSARTNRKGWFKFVVPASVNSNFLAYWDWHVLSPFPAPSGYYWRGFDPYCSYKARHPDKLKSGSHMTIKPDGHNHFKLRLAKSLTTPARIYGEVSHHNKPVYGAKVRLLKNGRVVREGWSSKIGSFWLNVDHLSSGKYELTAKYKPRQQKQSDPAPKKAFITIHKGWLYIDQKIWVDLPLQNETKTININMISFGEKIGYTGP